MGRSPTQGLTHWLVGMIEPQSDLSAGTSDSGTTAPTTSSVPDDGGDEAMDIVVPLEPSHLSHYQQNVPTDVQESSTDSGYSTLGPIPWGYTLNPLDTEAQLPDAYPPHFGDIEELTFPEYDIYDPFKEMTVSGKIPWKGRMGC